MGTDDHAIEHVGRFTRTTTSVILECAMCGDIELITALPAATASHTGHPAPE